jgi:hypothetical protein
MVDPATARFRVSWQDDDEQSVGVGAVTSPVSLLGEAGDFAFAVP